MLYTPTNDHLKIMTQEKKEPFVALHVLFIRQLLENADDVQASCVRRQAKCKTIEPGKVLITFVNENNIG
jgi:hypothetical protein